jgi:hypothetical protein
LCRSESYVLTLDYGEQLIEQCYEYLDFASRYFPTIFNCQLYLVFRMGTFAFIAKIFFLFFFFFFWHYFIYIICFHMSSLVLFLAGLV